MFKYLRYICCTHPLKYFQNDAEEEATQINVLPFVRRGRNVIVLGDARAWSYFIGFYRHYFESSLQSL